MPSNSSPIDPAACPPRRLRRVGTIVVLTAVAALPAGCGSYTKSDFIARADAICASSVRQTRTISPPSFGRTAAEQLSALGDYLNRVLPIARSEVSQLRGLKLPKQTAAEGATLAGYLVAVGRAVGDYQALAAAAARADARGVSDAEAALRASPAATLAARYGLRSCSAPGATVA